MPRKLRSAFCFGVAGSNLPSEGGGGVLPGTEAGFSEASNSLNGSHFSIPSRHAKSVSATTPWLTSSRAAFSLNGPVSWPSWTM